MDRRPSSLQQVEAFVVRKVGLFLRAERAGRKALRKFSWLRKFVLVLLPALLVFAYLVPYLMTGESSLLAVRDVCRGRWITRVMVRLDIDAEEAADIYEGSAGSRLHPTHIFDAVPPFFSIGCFLMWTFFTPHHAMSASALDQKRTFAHPLYLFFKCIMNRWIADYPPHPPPPPPTSPSPPPPPLKWAASIFFKLSEVFFRWPYCH
jgi:hypothetical protein